MTNPSPIKFYIANRPRRADLQPDAQTILRDIIRHRKDLEHSSTAKAAELKQAGGLILFCLTGTVNSEHLCQAGAGNWLYQNGNVIRGVPRGSKTVAEAIQFLNDLEAALSGIHTADTQRLQQLGWFPGVEAEQHQVVEDRRRQAHQRGRETAVAVKQVVPVQLPVDIAAEVEASTAQILASGESVERLKASYDAVFHSACLAERAYKTRQIDRKVLDEIRHAAHQAQVAWVKAKAEHGRLVNQLTMGQLVESTSA